MGDFLIMSEGGTDRQTNRQTNTQTHINTKTRPRLRAGPSENHKLLQGAQPSIVAKILT